jgi:ABC-2 type transport system permease protein
MQKLKYIYEAIKREILVITNDVNIISVILLAPLFYAFFYSTVYINKVENELPVGIVDYDNSINSQKLITDLNAHQMINIIYKPLDYEEGKKLLEKNKIQGLIIIPKGFESDIKQMKGTKVKVYLNTTRFLVSNDINKAVTEVVLNKSIEYRKEFYKNQGYSIEQATELSDPVRLDMRPLYNTTESYGDFMLPGLLALILHQTLLIGLAESVAKEREQNTLKELFATAGNRPLIALLGKTAFYFFLFAAYSFFFYSVNFKLFKLNLNGDMNLLAFITLLYILAVLFLSVFIATFFERKIISLQVFAFTSIPLFLISGYSYPMQAIPWGMQLVSNLLPSTAYLSAMVRLTQMSASFNEILPEIIKLLIFVTVGFLAASYRFYRLSKDHN